MNIKLEIKKLTKTDKINIALRNIFNIYLFNLKIKILINWKNNTNNFIRNFNLYKQYFIFSEFDRIEFNSDSDIRSDSGSDSNSHSDFDSDSNSSNEQQIFINEFNKYDNTGNTSDDYNLHDNISESDSDIDLDFEKIDNIDFK